MNSTLNVSLGQMVEAKLLTVAHQWWSINLIMQINVFIQSETETVPTFPAKGDGNSWNSSSWKYKGPVGLYCLHFCGRLSLVYGLQKIFQDLHQPNCKTLRDLIWWDFSLSSSHLFFFFTCIFPNLTLQLFFKLQFISHGFLFNELPTTHASVLTLLCCRMRQLENEVRHTNKHAHVASHAGFHLASG